MTLETHSKVQARHLKRHASLYIRQSSLRQVLEHTESTQRQYNLKQRAIALGWAHDQIVVVDNDQGLSGASAVDRAGFQTLVADVGMGRAGMVMGLEVSRLARNSTDWHRLLEICALTDTLILDEDGIYDPAHFNDRLLLGLKGTMSEAELHVLRARLIGGILNKARRGELQCRVPIGLVYDAAGRVVLDPDQQVQHTIRVFFETFRRTGSATATVKSFRDQGVSFPRRLWHGARKGEVIWGPLDHPRTLWVLHNPRYAGAFVYGRTRQRHQDRKYHKLPREEWLALVRDAHPSDISWDQFEQHQTMLRDNAAGYGTDRRRSPPREGPALLQGVVICGRCGLRMTVRYHQSRGTLVPIYTCQREGIQHGHAICQQITGASIDDAIGALVVEAVSPMALEVTLGIQQELQSRLDEADALRRKAVDRAQYDVDLARQRFMRVDPNNRLVADSLEADWNDKLRLLNEVQERYRQQHDADCVVLGDEQRTRILALATDVPRLWRDAATPDRERKRMLRLIVDDVTLVKGKELVVHVRFRGGVTRTLTLPRPAPAWALRQTSPEVVAEIGGSGRCGEVRALLLLRRQPNEIGACKHRVEQHQTVNDTARRERPTMATVGLADGSIERLVVHVIDAPAVVSTRVRGGESTAHELVEELPRLLPVNDAGEGGVLAQEADARVQHYGHEEPCLALREPELGDGFDAFLGGHRNTSSAKPGSNGDEPPVRALDPRNDVKPDRLAAAPCAPR